MKKRLIIGLFLCICFVQIIIPISMILNRESVLKNGEQFKFKTVPVDPYDAFRGRFVALRIEENSVCVSNEMSLKRGMRGYAHIAVDEQGFAKCSAVTRSRPKGVAYIKTRVGYTANDKVYLELPIDRYYMEEKSAPVAERIYRKHNRQDKQDTYVLIRVKDGLAVIQGLYVGGRRIEEVVRNEKK